jgi:hypothetical protein
MTIWTIGNNRKDIWILGRDSKQWMIIWKPCLYISKHWRKNNWRKTLVRDCLNKVNNYIESITQDQEWTNTRNKCLKNNEPCKKDTKETMTNKYSLIITNNKNKYLCRIKELWTEKFALSTILILIKM